MELTFCIQNYKAYHEFKAGASILRMCFGHKNVCYELVSVFSPQHITVKISFCR